VGSIDDLGNGCLMIALGTWKSIKTKLYWSEVIPVFIIKGSFLDIKATENSKRLLLIQVRDS